MWAALELTHFSDQKGADFPETAEQPPSQNAKATHARSSTVVGATRSSAWPRARKGARQKLLLMASRGQSQLFVVLGTYTADHILSFRSARRFVDFQTASTFDPSNRELQFHWRQEPIVRPCSPQSQTRLIIILSSRSTSRASLPPNAFRQKFGT